MRHEKWKINFLEDERVNTKIMIAITLHANRGSRTQARANPSQPGAPLKRGRRIQTRRLFGLQRFNPMFFYVHVLCPKIVRFYYLQPSFFRFQYCTARRFCYPMISSVSQASSKPYSKMRRMDCHKQRLISKICTLNLCTITSKRIQMNTPRRLVLHLWGGGFLEPREPKRRPRCTLGASCFVEGCVSWIVLFGEGFLWAVECSTPTVMVLFFFCFSQAGPITVGHSPGEGVSDGSRTPHPRISIVVALSMHFKFVEIHVHSSPSDINFLIICSMTIVDLFRECWKSWMS